jgi:hypothetical protein
MDSRSTQEENAVCYHPISACILQVYTFQQVFPSKFCFPVQATCQASIIVLHSKTHKLHYCAISVTLTDLSILDVDFFCINHANIFCFFHTRLEHPLQLAVPENLHIYEKNFQQWQCDYDSLLTTLVDLESEEEVPHMI